MVNGAERHVLGECVLTSKYVFEFIFNYQLYKSNVYLVLNQPLSSPPDVLLPSLGDIFSASQLPHSPSVCAWVVPADKIKTASVTAERHLNVLI